MIKPIEVVLKIRRFSAIQWLSWNSQAVYAFIGQKNFYVNPDSRVLVIDTNSGNETVYVEDWILKHNGQLTHFKDIDFRENFKSLEDLIK